jgi:WD40 repeat protein
LRSSSVIYSCKKHEAGVTWLRALENNIVITCSYDGTVRIWDERFMKGGAVEELSFPGKSLWDINYRLCPETN